MNLVDKHCSTWEYFTPGRILEPVRRYFALEGFPGGIELDPATVPANPTRAAHFYTAAEDGLSKPWTVKGKSTCVFINPPYGRAIRDWVAKLHREASDGNKIVALLPAVRFEQLYWHQHVFNERLTGLCLVRRRIGFLQLDGKVARSNPHASLLYFYNATWEHVVRCFSLVGPCVRVGEVVGGGTS